MWIWRPDEKSAVRCSVTSGIDRGNWCTSTSRNFGKIPTGGGHRVHGRVIGRRNSRLTATLRKNYHPVIGYGYVHTALDDHSRLAYSEVLPERDRGNDRRLPGGGQSPGSPPTASPSNGF